MISSVITILGVVGSLAVFMVLIRLCVPWCKKCQKKPSRTNDTTDLEMNVLANELAHRRILTTMSHYGDWMQPAVPDHVLVPPRRRPLPLQFYPSAPISDDSPMSPNLTPRFQYPDLDSGEQTEADLERHNITPLKPTCAEAGDPKAVEPAAKGQGKQGEVRQATTTSQDGEPLRRGQPRPKNKKTLDLSESNPDAAGPP